MSALESWKLAGIVLGSLSGGFMAGAWGLRVPMFFQCVPALLSSGVALTLAEPPRTHGAPDAPPSRHYFAILSGGLGQLRRHPVLRALTIDLVSVGTVSWLILWSWPPQLDRSGIPLALFGVVHSAMCLGQIAILSRQHALERMFGGIIPLVRITAIVPPLGYMALAATSHPAASLAGILLVSVLGLSRGPLFSGALNRHIASEERATVLSAVSAARTLAIAVVYPVAGVLMDLSLPLAFAAFGISGLLAAVLGAAPRTALEPEMGTPSSPVGSIRGDQDRPHRK